MTPDRSGTDQSASETAESRPQCEGWLVNLGWLNTTMALSLNLLPFQFLLKDQLHLDAESLARFLLIANVPIYLKPLAGILVDAVPLFGTRRRHYVVYGFVLAAVFWLLLGLIPRNFGALLANYLVLNLFLTLVSTVLGGLMVEVGQRENQTGRLGSQRQAITQLSGAIGGPMGGLLVKAPFMVTAALCSVAYATAAPVFWRNLREKGNLQANRDPFREVREQLSKVFASGTLWAATGLIVLVAAAPGFGTPLFFHQSETLKFSSEYIGVLAVIGNGFGGAAAWAYSRMSHRFTLRRLLVVSIVAHGFLTLLYLLYRTPLTAGIVTAIEGVTMAFAILPLYDLAARSTPRGSEALGYSVIQSIWNLATMLSNYAGSWLYSEWNLTFQHLIWINSGTTLLVLLGVPLLPSALIDRSDRSATSRATNAP